MAAGRGSWGVIDTGGSPYTQDLFPETDDTLQIGRLANRWQNGRFSREMQVLGSIHAGDVPSGSDLAKVHIRRGSNGSQLSVSLLNASIEPVDLIVENLEEDTSCRFVMGANKVSGSPQTNDIEFWGNANGGDFAHGASLISGSSPGTSSGQINGDLRWETTDDAESPVERMRLQSTGQLVIGAVGSDGSSLLEVTSTTRGFLPPRMTTTQRDAIVSPASGLQVYDNVVNRPYFYNGTVWGAFGVQTLGDFDANDAVFPATDPAAASSRNGHPILVFDDTTAESVILSKVMPTGYLSGNVLVDVDWTAAAIADDVVWGVEFERDNPGGASIDSDSFAAQQTGTDTVNGSTGVVTRTTVTLTQAQADSIAAGDAYRLRLERVAGDVGDDMVGDAQVLRVAVRQ